MKKSSSFHAFSTELPTLIEVEEQLSEDPFHYGQHYYLNNPHNQAMYHQHQHQQHSMPHQMGYTISNQAASNSNNQMTNQFSYLNHTANSSYSSLPHSQVFNDLNDSNNKNKLTNSLSANNLNQFNMSNNLSGHVNNNNNINNASNLNNKSTRRHQRYPQQNGNVPFNLNGPFNNNNVIKQPWGNNFQTGPMNQHSGFLPLPPLLHPSQMSGPAHLNNQPFNSNLGPLGPQPLGPPNQGFMQPPPNMGQLHPNSNGQLQTPFMHQPPPPHHMSMPPLNHPAPQGPQGLHRPNFFNPISSFMFGPPPPSQAGHVNPNQNGTHQPDHNNNYYFPSATNSSANNPSNQGGQNKTNQPLNNNQRSNNTSKTSSSDGFLNNSSNGSNNNSKQQLGYQQVN